jgi:hypothetical protein
MKHATAKLALALSLALSATASFAQAAYVEGVQMPAWVERNGTKQPLAAGTALQAGDKITTGADARLLLKLSEGSAVKLGENAVFNVNQLSAKQEGRLPFVSAALEVARGAFRFTTDVALKGKSKRDVSIKFPTVTAGIRGTDIWGKGADDRDIVCLIEGDIAVQREGDPEFRMNEALQFYITPKTADGKVDRTKPDPKVVPVNPEKLKEWATETDIGAGKGALKRGGKWKVIVASLPAQSDALSIYDALRTNGYPAELYPAIVSGKRMYDVRISSLPSKAEAEALATKVATYGAGATPRVSL